jgi:hypothetical protein
MLVATIVLLVLAGVVLGARIVQARNRRRRFYVESGAAGLGLHHDDAQELIQMLSEAAAEELALLHLDVTSYVHGPRVGYVVALTESGPDLILHLSDGRRLAAGGVAQRSRRMLAARADVDLLRPSVIERDGPSYRLSFTGHVGPAAEIHARRLSLAVVGEPGALPAP